MNSYKECIDINNNIIDFLVGTVSYQKNIYDRTIRELSIISNIYEGHNESCNCELLRTILDECESEFIMAIAQFSDKNRKIDNINDDIGLLLCNDKLYNKLMSSCHFDAFKKYYLKYFNKLYKYILECKRRKELSLWT